MEEVKKTTEFMEVSEVVASQVLPELLFPDWKVAS